MIHAQAIVESTNVGAGTSVGAFTRVLGGARIGEDCAIGDQVWIGDDAVLGDHVVVLSGARIAVPGDGRRDPGPPRTNIRNGVSIGANATILSGVTIGQGARIGSGAVIASDVPANTILAGNPAKIVGYVGTTTNAAPLAAMPETPGSYATHVAGVRLHRLPLIEDLRGLLTFGEVQRHVPFEIRRYFLSFGVSNEHIRGEHAHRKLHQFLVCVHGRLHVMADDGRNREEFILDTPALGLHIPPMVWATEYRYSPDAVLLVLASDYYDAADYIRDHAEFLALVLN